MLLAVAYDKGVLALLQQRRLQRRLGRLELQAITSCRVLLSLMLSDKIL